MTKFENMLDIVHVLVLVQKYEWKVYQRSERGLALR